MPLAVEASVGISTVRNPENDDFPSRIVDAEVDPVRAAARCPSAFEFITQWCSDSTRRFRQVACNQLEDG